MTWNPGAGTGWKSSPNITSVVSEVINRTGWTANNRICIVVKDGQVSNNQLQSAAAYDGNPANAARLNISFAAAMPQ